MDPKDYITLSDGITTVGDKDTITLSSGIWNTTNITGNPYTISVGAGVNNPWATYTSSPKIRLDGDGADIEVNGRSLMDMIERIEQRLNILHPNETLEAEWAELRALGEQYRQLEQHIKDKQDTWDKLKAMPPPVIN
jgi:hypothetical protein